MKVLIFQKNCFKVKVLKKFKIPRDFHIKKHADLLNEGYFKNP